MARLRPSLFLLVGCVLLQHAFADPRPEFGSIGTVQSSLTIRNTVNTITPLLNAVDDKNGLVLQTDYSLFTEVLPLMESLGTKVTELGPPVTNAIVTAVPRTDGNYDAVFDPIIAAITAFKNFISGEQASTRNTLKQKLGDDIDHLFGDSFGNMANALTQVESAMLRLKGALRTAPVRNGRAQVDPAIITDVVVGVSFLKATVSPVEYTIQSTIENIEFADSFLYDLEDMNAGLISNLEEYATDFANALTGDANLVVAAATTLQTSWQTIKDGLADATSNIGSLTEYTNGANQGVEKFTAALSSLTSFTNGIPSEVTTYLSIADTYFTEYTNILVPRSYAAITYVMEVLIAGGPHSRFCYFKYSPRLLNYYALLVSDVEVCYNLEAYRLASLETLAIGVFKLIMFDFEDLIDHLTVCNNKSPPGPCLSAIGPYYNALGDKTIAKLTAIYTSTLAEFTASVKRLGSCVLTSRLKNMQALISAVADIESCHDLGPQDPN
uniref:Protein TsetseEP domain-containing protein n=1 Tax=Anopheles culicifacies TaxID=139723 RepID=A0A182MIY5_9DIPT